jgi:hypothetical protein
MKDANLINEVNGYLGREDFMNDITDDLDRRLAVQIERAKIRHVEMMEETDRWHQRHMREREQEERRRQRYERFKWLYWGGGAVAFFVIAAGWGLLIGDFLKVLSQPRTVVIQMPPPAPPDAAPTKP